MRKVKVFTRTKIVAVLTLNRVEGVVGCGGLNPGSISNMWFVLQVIIRCDLCFSSQFSLSFQHFGPANMWACGFHSLS